MRRHLTWLSALALAGLSAPAPAADDLGPRLQGLLADTVARVKAPGGVMLVATPHGRWLSAVGLADKNTNRAMQVEDGFRISSMSKVFVATTVLKLCEEGRLQLDQPAAGYLPAGTLDGIANGSVATIRQLLWMTSGIPDYPYLPPFRRIVEGDLHPAPWQDAEILKFIVGRPAIFEPGDNQAYANVNFIILEMVVNAVTGHTLAAEIRRVVLDPLGLRDTFTEIAEPRDGGCHGLLTRGYEDDKDVTAQNESLGLADGGIISTAADLQTFLDALLRRRVLLGGAMLTEMCRFNPIDNYGLGLDRGASPWGPIIGHSGIGAGFGTNMRYLPEVDSFMIVLCNDVDTQLFNELFMPVLTMALPDHPPTPNGGYKVLDEWGWEGSDEEEFDGPAGIAIDRTGMVYVADYFNHRVQKMKPDGDLAKAWGHRGNGPGQFEQPAGVALGGNSQVFVADYRNHRIEVFTTQGIYLGQWGAQGDGPSQFNEPAAVAADGHGLVFVADDHNHRIQVFNEWGVFQRQWGGLGDGPGQFKFPRGVATDGRGNVYVADQGNGRIQRFTADGRFVTQWRPSDAGWRDPPYLEAVACDPAGMVWVADGGRCCLYRYSPEGRPLLLWRGFDAGTDCFGHPQAVAIGLDNSVYVGDAVSNDVVKLAADTP